MDGVVEIGTESVGHVGTLGESDQVGIAGAGEKNGVDIGLLEQHLAKMQANPQHFLRLRIIVQPLVFGA